MLHVIHDLFVCSSLDERLDILDGTLDGLGDLVDILRFDYGLQVIFKDLSEVVLQFRSTPVFENLFPVWGIVIPAQVWLELSTEDLERCTLADAVSSNQSKYLSRSWRGQSVELEAVGRVSVSDLGLKVGGQVDDMDCTERAFLWADATTDAKTLRDEGDLGFGRDLDAEFSRAYNRAASFAFLPTFLGLALCPLSGHVPDDANRENSLTLSLLTMAMRVSLSDMLAVVTVVMVVMVVNGLLVGLDVGFWRAELKANTWS